MSVFGPLADLHLVPPSIPSFLIVVVTLATLFYAWTGRPIKGHHWDPIIILTAGNVINFLLQGLGLFPGLYLTTLGEAALRPALFLQGYQWWAPLTSMFMHGGFLHIFGNMLFLWFFGSKILDRMGRRQFVLLYLAAGLFADVVTLIGSLFYSPELAWIISNPMTPNLGASGAVYGLIGVSITAFPNEKVPIPIPLGFVAVLHPVRPIVAAIVYIGLNLFQWLIGSNVAWWAHLAGMLVGVLWGVWWRKSGPRVRIDGMTGWGSGGPVSYTYSYRQR